MSLISARQARPLRFVTLPTGCFVLVSHKPNKDGYFRLNMDKQRMLHRTVLEMRGVEIPEGYEVDHLCQNRGCCNPEHLEVKQRKTHLEETNRNRYAVRKAAAVTHWRETGCSATALAEKYEVCYETARGWIRGAGEAAH